MQVQKYGSIHQFEWNYLVIETKTETETENQTETEKFVNLFLQLTSHFLNFSVCKVSFKSYNASILGYLMMFNFLWWNLLTFWKSYVLT